MYTGGAWTPGGGLVTASDGDVNWQCSSSTVWNYIPLATSANVLASTLAPFPAAPSAAYRTYVAPTAPPGYNGKSYSLLVAYAEYFGGTGTKFEDAVSTAIVLATSDYGHSAGDDPAVPKSSNWQSTIVEGATGGTLTQGDTVWTVLGDKFSRPRVAVDNNPKSAHCGRTYVLYNVLHAKSAGCDNELHTGFANCWDFNRQGIRLAAVDFTAGANGNGQDHMVTYTRGSHNDIFVPPTPPGGGGYQQEAGGVAVGPDGTVFISWLEEAGFDWWKKGENKWSSSHPTDFTGTSDASVRFAPADSNNDSARGNSATIHVAFSTDGGETFTEFNPNSTDPMLGGDTGVTQAGLFIAPTANIRSLAGYYAYFDGYDNCNNLLGAPAHSYYAMPVSSAPEIAVGGANTYAATQSYPVYLTWTDGRGSPKARYNGIHSQIMLAALSYHTSSATSPGWASAQPPTTWIYSQPLEPAPSCDDAQGHKHVEGDVFQFGPSVAVDDNDSVYVSYYSAACNLNLDGICPGGASANTQVIVAHQIADVIPGTPAFGYYRVTDAITYPQDFRTPGIEAPSAQFYPHTFVVPDLAPSRCAPPTQCMVFWIDNRRKTRYVDEDDVATSGDYDSKNIFVQVLRNGDDVVNVGLTDNNNQRKVVFDGRYYHFVFQRTLDTVHPTRVYYARTCDIRPTDGIPGDAFGIQFERRLSDPNVESANPSLCMYKNGDTVRIGITWESHAQQLPSTIPDTVYYAMFQTGDYWQSQHWVSAVPIVKHAGSSTALDYPTTPVIAPVVRGTSDIRTLGSDQYFVDGIDPDTTGFVGLQDAPAGTTTPTQTKRLIGFIVSLAHKEGWLDPPQYEYEINPGNPSVIEGVYSVMVNSSGALKSEEPNAGLRPASFRAIDGLTCSPSSQMSGLNAGQPTLAASEGHILDQGLPSELSYRDESASLAWVENPPHCSNGGPILISPTSQIVLFNELQPVPTATTGFYTLSVTNENRFGGLSPNPESNPSIATRYVQDKTLNGASQGRGVPILAWQGNWTSWLVPPGGSVYCATCPPVGGVPHLVNVTGIYTRETYTDLSLKPISTVVLGATIIPIRLDGSPVEPYGGDLQYLHPSVTANPYHGLVEDAQSWHWDESDLAALAFEIPSSTGASTIDVLVGKRGQAWKRLSKTPLLHGYWPSLTFQTFGHYDLGVPGRNITNALAYNAAPSSTLFAVDPTETSQYFAKITDDPHPDSLINYRCYHVSVDTGCFFNYTAGEVLVTYPDSSQLPIAFVPIPDTVVYRTQSDLEGILRTNPFPVQSGCNISFYHNISPSDTVLPYLRLGPGKMLLFRTDLVVRDTAYPLDGYAAVGVSDSSQVKLNFVSDPFDTVFLGALPTDSGYVRITVTVADPDSTDVLHRDPMAFQAINVFASHSCRPDVYDSTGRFLGKVARYAGRAGIVWEPVNPIRLEAYPNPFKGSTEIAFTVPEEDASDLTEVRVFDLLGRDVATLVHEVKLHGRYTASFGGADLKTGSYIVAVLTRTHMQSKELVLVR